MVEREGLSIRHPARFVLIGSGNPEEGELRPQMLDRFGLSVEVRTPQDLEQRIDIIKRRDAFERDPVAFLAQYEDSENEFKEKILSSRKRLAKVTVGDDVLTLATKLCAQLGTDGLRGELTLMRGMRALAAFDGARKATAEHLKRLAPLALRHRLRRNPLDDSSSTTRVERVLADFF